MPLHRLEIDSADLASEIGQLSGAEFDKLPFGTIQLDPQGNILTYNSAEERLSGRKRSDVLGKNFFTEVAPCTRVKQFQVPFEAGIRNRQLNEVFDYTFRFSSGKREVRIRMIYSEARGPAVWIFVSPIDGLAS